MARFKVGDRVRHSGCVLRDKRDYWNWQGAEPAKSRAKQWLDDATAERGTVTALLAGDSSRGVSPGVEVTWDSGSVSRCLDYRIEPA